MARNVSEAEQSDNWDWWSRELQQVLYILILIVLVQFFWDFTPPSSPEDWTD